MPPDSCPPHSLCALFEQLRSLDVDPRCGAAMAAYSVRDFRLRSTIRGGDAGPPVPSLASNASPSGVRSDVFI